MRRMILLGLLLLFVVSPAAADTKVGQVDTQRILRYSFRPVGGTVDITLSWLNGGADLVMVLVCDDDDPTVFGMAAGLLTRFARINAGVVPNVECELGVTAARNGSKFWLNILMQTDTSVTGAGRTSRLGVTEGVSNLSLAIDDQLFRLIRKVQ